MKKRILDFFDHELILTREDIKRALRIFVAYTYILLLCFFVNVVFNLEFIPFGVPSMAIPVLFSFLMLAYLLAVETTQNYIGFVLVKMVGRIGKYGMLIQGMIILTGVVALISFIRNKDFVFFGNPLLIFCLIVAFYTGLLLRNIFISMHLIRLWKRTNHLKLTTILLAIFYLYCFVAFYQIVPWPALLEGVVLGFVAGLCLGEVSVRIQQNRALYRDASILDWETLAGKQSKAKKIYRMIQKGMLLRAQLFLLLWWGKLSDREKCKIRCRIWYRRRKFNKVIDKADEFLVKEKSDVIIALKALSLTTKGEYEAAKKLLHDVLDHERKHRIKNRNPYVPLNLGYIFWLEDKIDEAIEYTRQSLNIHSRCPLAWNNLAFYSCEKALLATPLRPGEFYRYLEQARTQIKNAFKYAAFSCYSTLLDTRGFIHLLLGEFKEALDCFSRVIYIDNDARLHLAILFMVNTKTYSRSEYFLTKVEQSLSKTPKHKTYKLARKNLQRIRKARNKVYFNEEIVFYFFKDQLPKHAMIQRKHMGRVLPQVFKSREFLKQLIFRPVMIEVPPVENESLKEARARYMTFKLGDLAKNTYQLKFITVQ